MAKYVLSQEFKQLNIGLALDEGLATPDDVIPVYYGERNVFWVKFHCHGNPGHGSRFIKDTAAEKVQYLTNKLLGYRLDINHSWPVKIIIFRGVYQEWHSAV